MGRALAVGFAVLSAGCGRFAFDPIGPGSGGDDVPSDGDLGDVPTDGSMLAACQRAPVTGTAIYVDGAAGADTNAGSSAAPVRTITHALAIAPANATVVVRPGNYTFEPNNEVLVTTTGALRLVSEQPYRAHVPRITCNNCSNLTVEDFEIGGGTLSAVQIAFSQNVTIRNNVVHGSPAAGVRLAGDALGTVVVDNMIYDTANALVHINSDSQGDVRDNVMFDTTPQTSSNPIVWLEGAQNSVLAGNVMFHTMHQVAGYGAISLGSVLNVTVENNLFGPSDPAYVTDGAIGLDSASGVATFRFNTFIGPFPGAVFGLDKNSGAAGGSAFMITHDLIVSPTASAQPFSNATQANPAGFALSRNLYWNAGVDFVETGNTLGPADDPTALRADPMLTIGSGVAAPTWNAQTQVFADGSTTVCEVRASLIGKLATLPATSPAVGAATIAAPATDIRGRVRPDPATLGAYEP